VKTGPTPALVLARVSPLAGGVAACVRRGHAVSAELVAAFLEEQLPPASAVRGSRSGNAAT
jgi:hypothetical protein